MPCSHTSRLVSYALLEIATDRCFILTCPQLGTFSENPINFWEGRRGCRSLLLLPTLAYLLFNIHDDCVELCPWKQRRKLRIDGYPALQEILAIARWPNEPGKIKRWITQTRVAEIDHAADAALLRRVEDGLWAEIPMHQHRRHDKQLRRPQKGFKLVSDLCLPILRHLRKEVFARPQIQRFYRFTVRGRWQRKVSHLSKGKLMERPEE